MNDPFNCSSKTDHEKKLTIKCYDEKKKKKKTNIIPIFVEENFTSINRSHFLFDSRKEVHSE